MRIMRLFLLVILGCTCALSALASTTDAIAFQGRVKSSGGLPVPNGAYRMSFTLFDADEGGTSLWTETDFAVTVTSGLFSTQLGSITPFPAGLYSDENTLFLEVAIDVNNTGLDVDDIQLPRTPLNAVPVAFHAKDAATLAGQPPANFVTTADLAATESTIETDQVAQDSAITLKANAVDVYTKAQMDTQQSAQDDAIALKAAAAEVYTKTEVDTQEIAQDDAIAVNLYTRVQVDILQAEQDAVTALKANTADVDTALAGKLGRRGESHVVVTTTSDPAQNGLNLLAAYAEARVLTPHGAAISADNRVAVIVPPGQYDLGIAQLTLDTEFVDLIGLSSKRESQFIFGESNGVGTGVIGQSADDVGIENLRVRCTRSAGGLATNNTDPAAYFPESGNPLTRVTNCKFESDNANALSMRAGVTYGGIFTDCAAGNASFGYLGFANGTFSNCTGGSESFGANGGAFGTFINCIGGSLSFGGNGFAGGKFTNCVGGGGSFGVNGAASGTFTNCTGGENSFAGFGAASGTFTNCIGDNNSFGGGNTGNTAGARLFGCRLNGDTWSGTFLGRMENCYWPASITLGNFARIYASTIVGTVDMNNTAAGVAQCRLNNPLLSAGSALFNEGNVVAADVN